MSQLSASQTRQVGAYWANLNFVIANVTANYSLDDLQAAAASRASR
jgi:hypothetical protein